MAGLFASMAVKWAVDSLASLLPALPPAGLPQPSAAASQPGLEDLRLLERTMRRIRATLHDAEQHWNVREESTKLRLKELRDLAYDAEDVVDEYEYEVNRFRVQALELAAALHQAAGDGSSSSKRKREEAVHEEHCSVEAGGIVPVPNELALRARKLIQRFVEIKDYSDSFSLSENDGERIIVPDIRSVRQTSSFVFAPRIIGREKDKENVIEKLVSGEGSEGIPMSVFVIVGMGGLGKTTLAQLVYNDTRVCQSFDLRAWVRVSECFNVESITRKIISSLTQFSCDHVPAGELQGALVNQVTEKRVFLVLDDVWNERSDLWELLCMPMLASRRSVVLVTTRNKAVARLVQTVPFYNLNCLSPDESWSLFKQTSFVDSEIVTAANLVEIGRRITEKCKGLPLAIKALASMLRYETDEMKWRDALESELWDLEQSRNEVLAALELSYKCMPIHLKRCFVALSLYPKGFYLDEYRVVFLWKQLGLLQCDGSDTMDDIGSLYVKEFVQRSLLQSYMHGQIIMHDLVHDLACFLAGGEFFRLEGDEPIEIPQEARYLSIALQDKKNISIANASQSLRAIIMLGNTYFQNPEALFLNCKKYRTIHIERGNLAKALLDCMGGMKLLRCFTVIGNEKATPLVIPNSLFQLVNLRELNFGADTLHGIGRLVNLHTLPDIRLSKCSCFYNIRELRNLNKVRNLCIFGLCNASIRDANEARLYHKKSLEILELHFDPRESCEHKERAGTNNETTVPVSAGPLLESLRPHHQNLRELKLTNFSCDMYPSWLGSASFSMLTELWLVRFQAQHLPTLGELPSLKTLRISNIEYVQQIEREFCSLDPSVNGFRSLTHLSLDSMYRLSEWSEVQNGDFPLLETLNIWNAFELRSLPLSSFLSLRSLSLCGCRNFVTLPSSDTLRELSVVGSESLNEIQGLPSLRSLELINCPSLVACAHFPLLTTLYLNGPFKEEIVHKLVKSHLLLERLSVSSDTIMSINLEPQNLPGLMNLVLRCPNLEYCKGLGRFTSLKSLYAEGCPRLHIPDSLRGQLEKMHAPEP